MGFGRKLAEYRSRSGVKQDEFADILWMNRSHLNEIEREKVNPPRLETIVFMIGVLNLSPEEALDLLREAKPLKDPESLVVLERLVKSLQAFEVAASALGPIVARLQRAFHEAEHKFQSEFQG